MELPYPLLLALHVAFGTAALVSGPAALIARKGGRWHKRLGLAFVCAMVITGLSSLALAVHTGKTFLFAVGVFSLYLSISGYRSIQWKRLMKRGRKGKRADWIISLSIIAFGIIMVGWGISTLIKGQSGGTISIVFGVIGAFMGLGDIRILSGNNRKFGFWVAAHISKMIGALIAAYTALLVVNQPDWMPSLVAWLGPTVLGTMLIFYWQKRLRLDVVKEEPELAHLTSQMAAAYE
jgi:uncharacterized membrane protein